MALVGLVAMTAGAVAIPAPAQAARACSRLAATDGAWAYVCKTWYADGLGAYDGSWWTTSKSANATVWWSADGDMHQGSTGSYSGVKEFYLSVCGPQVCSRWW